MSITSIDKQAHNQLLAHRNRLYTKGYEEFHPSIPCPCSLDPSQQYYYKCGWDRADREYQKHLAERAREHCPHCGSPMEDLASINRCTNIAECGHHTHK